MNDKAMMQEPDRWPRWPVLPLKRIVDGNLQTACLIEQGMTKKFLFVLNANLFSIATDIQTGKAKPVPADIDKIVADGWLVD